MTTSTARGLGSVSISDGLPERWFRTWLGRISLFSKDVQTGFKVQCQVGEQPLKTAVRDRPHAATLAVYRRRAERMFAGDRLFI